MCRKKCLYVLRNLRCYWMQDPEVALNEALKTIVLDSDYLKTSPELFEICRQNLYRRLKNNSTLC